MKTLVKIVIVCLGLLLVPFVNVIAQTIFDADSVRCIKD